MAGLLIKIFILMQLVACATTPGSDMVYYKVKVRQGDSLASIAGRFGLTWQEVAKQNSLRKPQDLRIGMELTVVPGPGGRLASSEVVEEDEGEDEDNWGQTPVSPCGDTGVCPQLSWPVNGSISSNYGMRGRRMHQGIDIRGQTGTSIRAAGRGTVVFAGRKRGYGRTIIIDHGNLKTLYAHLYRIDVEPGDKIERNQYIGQVGSSGNAKGAHLHFEVRKKDDSATNPLAYLKTRSNSGGGLFSSLSSP